MYDIRFEAPQRSQTPHHDVWADRMGVASEFDGGWGGTQPGGRSSWRLLHQTTTGSGRTASSALAIQPPASPGVSTA